MKEVIKQVYEIIDERDRRNFAFVTFLIVLTSLIDSLSLVSVFPFLKLLSSPEIIQENEYVNRVYTELGFENNESFFFFAGFGVFFFFTLSAVVRGYISWKVSQFTLRQNYKFTVKLFRKYLNRPYSFFLTRSSNDLNSHLLTNVNNVVAGIMMPILTILSSVLVSTWLLAVLLYNTPWVATVTLGIVGGIYLLINKLIKNKVAGYSKELVEISKSLYQNLNEAFGGIKELKYLNRNEVFVKKYDEAYRRHTETYVSYNTIGAFSPISIEVLGIGGIIFSSLILLKASSNFVEVVPLLGMFALVLKKLVPTFNSIFASFLKIKLNTVALKLIHQDFVHDKYEKEQKENDKSRMSLQDKIELKNVTFFYPETQEPTLKNMNVTIKNHSSVAFIGETGSGKTTTIDLLMGLLHPQAGELRIDDKTIDQTNREQWQNSIGYVPQNVFLTEDSIAHNIAFGDEEVDLEMVKQACSLAKISSFIEKLPQGYDTNIGERGVKLSGGQRQRLGIARALYRNPDVIVLDEATNSLDPETEKKIMEEINQLTGQKTIIMIAHRLSTVENCDHIYKLKDGKILVEGRFHEVVSN